MNLTLTKPLIRLKESLPLIGAGIEYSKGPLKMFKRIAHDYPDAGMIAFNLTSLPVCYMYHPDYIQHVLQQNHKNYTKPDKYSELRILLGNGLVTSEGSFWLQQRRLMQPAFHKQRLATFVKTMVEKTQLRLGSWEGKYHSGKSFDLSHEMMGLTLDIVTECLFGTNVSRYTEKVGDSLSFLIEALNKRIKSVVAFPMWMPTSANQKIKKEKTALDSIVLGIIKNRITFNKPYDDLLAMLIEMQDADTGEKMSEQQLRDEVMTLFVAGHETTANAITWAFYLLSQNPEIENKFHDELDLILKGNLPAIEDLHKLTYTMQIVHETLRLYPPAWMIGRKSIHDDEIDGYRIPAGTNILISQYMVQRDPIYWNSPDQFNPDNFLAEKEKTRHKFSYFPFGGGPRYCIGNNFSLMELQIILAVIGQHYRLCHDPLHQVALDPQITLRPFNGMKMILTGKVS
jgi:cytochrome P450